MKRLTIVNDDGSWGIKGYDIKKAPPELYGLLCKLKEYEDTGFSPEEIRTACYFLGGPYKKPDE